jgi:hypothetical protein
VRIINAFLQPNAFAGEVRTWFARGKRVKAQYGSSGQQFPHKQKGRREAGL